MMLYAMPTLELGGGAMEGRLARLTLFLNYLLHDERLQNASSQELLSILQSNEDVLRQFCEGTMIDSILKELSSMGPARLPA